MSSVLHRVAPLLRGLRRLVDGFAIVASVISGVVLLMVMVTIGVDVFLRNVRGAPLGGVVEWSEVGLVVLAFLGIGAAQRTDSHIAVTSVFQRLPVLGQRIAHVITTLVGATVCFVLFWYAFDLALTAFETGEVRLGAARAPMWPARTAVAAGFLLWGAELLSQIARLPEPDVAEDVSKV